MASAKYFAPCARPLWIGKRELAGLVGFHQQIVDGGAHRRIGDDGQRARHLGERPHAAHIGERHDERRLPLHPPERARHGRLVAGGVDGAFGLLHQRGKARLGRAFQHSGQASAAAPARSPTGTASRRRCLRGAGEPASALTSAAIAGSPAARSASFARAALASESDGAALRRAASEEAEAVLSDLAGRRVITPCRNPDAAARRDSPAGPGCCPRA